ncbi:MAG: hypothetical protein OXF27_08760, partial [Acidobacteria bacterium]|nr:hypothetical protein [Acidobacteriota bacterium]
MAIHPAARAVLAAGGLILLIPAGGAAQPEAPRTAWGAPDLQGIWDFRTITPLERPGELAGKAVLSDEETAVQEQLAAEDRVDRVPEAGDTGFYNRFWLDQGEQVVPTRRSSLIVDPPDGRLPALTAAERRRMAHRAVSWERPIRERVAGYMPNRIADGPEDLGIAERCILAFNSGPPMIPSFYNSAMHLLQTPDHVVILNEMVHDARIIPLDGRAHLPDGLRQWMGDSRAHWDGDTLVVETANFTDKTSSFSPEITSAVGSGANLRLAERFTRADARPLAYRSTADDP